MRCVPFFLPRCETDGLRGGNLAFCVFTGILFSVGPPGAPSFVARRKIGEKGVPRGLRPPLDPRGNVLGHSDVLCAYVFATVHLTRLRRLRRSAYPLASACCGYPERQPILCNHPTAKFALRRLFYKCYEFAAVGAVQSSPWKQCVARHGRA